MATELEAARLMIQRGGRQPRCGAIRTATQHCAMAKRLATDAGFAVVNEALQLHGGYGYIRDYPIERYLRDLRVHQILEGTNEIMRLIVGAGCSADRGPIDLPCATRGFAGQTAAQRFMRLIAPQPSW